MQAIKLVVLFLLFGAMLGCKSSAGTTEANESDQYVVDSWYLLEVGGMRESGRSHYYTVSLKDNCAADSIFFGDEAFPFAETEVKGVWQAYRHFGPEEEPPRGVLNGLFSLTCAGKSMQLQLDSIYLNETIILP